MELQFNQVYDKMQEWRDWCEVLAKKVVGLKDINL